MVIEGLVVAVKEVVKVVAEKSLETVKNVMEQEVKDLPDEIGELSEIDLLPEEIGGELEYENIQVVNDLKQYNTQENKTEVKNNDIQVNTDNVDGENEVIESEKKGGSYDEVFKEGEGERYEVHHMPSDSASNIERNDGPAIKMEKEDHRQTASCGSSKEAREYRVAQKELIDQGKFREALQMDIDDIYEKFGSKYNDAISEMLDYIDKLEAEGKIDG